MPDLNKNPVSLSDFKGKVLLVDFWASWCRPCRIENPKLVQLHNKYASQGFEILSVSLDGTQRQKNPKGPITSYDPNEPQVAKKVTKGGSYLCSDQYCSGYRPSARMKTSPESSLENTGFRCVISNEDMMRIMKKSKSVIEEY